MSTRTGRPGNLPAEATSFIGRRDEVAEGRRKLTSARLVTLVGPGGVGKTRLAVRLGADLGRGFPDGVWLIELAELEDPGHIDNAVMAALNLRDQAAAEPAALLRSFLRDKQLLLVLDNCEHLLVAAGRLVDDLLKGAPGVRVLATSREPLSVAGEHVLPVPPLRLPAPNEPLEQLRQNEAVSLFIERAAAASGSFALTATSAPSVVEVCRRLDGLPLAIELAAVRTRVLTSEQIRDRLNDRFDLLTGGSRSALPRHQTLRMTIEWSYDLLAPVEQALLTRLCVFAGRFTFADVESVCCYGDVPAVGALDLLSSLLDKSLVMKEDVAGTACYRLHETMREYSRLQLRTEETSTLEQRAADYYVGQCRRFAAEGRHRLLEWLTWMDLEVDNVRAVLRRCVDEGDAQRGIDLATGLVWFWVTRATTEGVRWLDELLDSPAKPEVHPWAYFTRGFLAVLQFDPAAGSAVLERAVSAARAAHLPNALAQSLAMASIAANQAGDREEARRLLDESRVVAEGIDEVGATLMVHEARALNGLVDGDYDVVAAAAAEGARLSREAGDLYSLGMMLMNHGFAALQSGDSRRAQAVFTEGLRTASSVDDRVAQCYLLGGLGCCAAESQPRLGAQLLGAMENLRAEVGATTNAGMAPAFAQATASLTAALGTAKYSLEFENGQHLSRDAARRLALREPVSPTHTASDQDSTADLLGRRPAEVARLVAEGLSNKEIGVRLFISERTVESHVRNILNKLGFNSRAQIAAWIATPRR